jgi:hypothetical protein
MANSESRRRVHHNGTGPTNQQATGKKKTRQPSVRQDWYQHQSPTPHACIRSKAEKKTYDNMAQVEGLHWSFTVTLVCVNHILTRLRVLANKSLSFTKHSDETPKGGGPGVIDLIEGFLNLPAIRGFASLAPSRIPP